MKTEARIPVNVDFVDFYLQQAGFDPADFNTGYLARIWNEAVERGIDFDIAYAIVTDSIRSDDGVFIQAINTHIWPDVKQTYREFRFWKFRF